MTPRLTLRSSHERTLESLYERHAAEVYRYALMMLGSPADAEDVTQTTFMNAYRALLGGERPRSAGPWLRTIAHNLCLQHFRQASRRPHEVELAEEEAADLVRDEEGFSADDLSRALKQIPANQRAALLMRELEGRPIAEIAGILEVSTSAVETLLFRARRAVREQLEGGLTCAEAELAISRQLDGHLGRRERGALRAHLRECQECARLARSLRAQRGAIKALAAIPLPGALAWSKFGASATAAGAGGAGGVAATSGGWLAGSMAAKLAGGAVVAALASGVTYEAVVHHPWTPQPVKARAHLAAAHERGHAPLGPVRARATPPAASRTHAPPRRHAPAAHGRAAPPSRTASRPPARSSHGAGAPVRHAYGRTSTPGARRSGPGSAQATHTPKGAAHPAKPARRSKRTHRAPSHKSHQPATGKTKTKANASPTPPPRGHVQSTTTTEASLPSTSP